MDKDIKLYLEKYRDATVSLIQLVEADELEKIEELIDVRQEILENLKNINCDNKEEAQKYIAELKIYEHQKRLDMLMHKKKNELKQQIDNLSKAKTLNNSYNAQVYTRPMFFSNKI